MHFGNALRNTHGPKDLALTSDSTPRAHFEGTSTCLGADGRRLTDGYFVNNSVILGGGTASYFGVGYSSDCGLIGHPELGQISGNTIYSDGQVMVPCSNATVRSCTLSCPLQSWVEEGHDVGTTLRPTPQDKEVVNAAKVLLGLSPSAAPPAKVAAVTAEGQDCSPSFLSKKCDWKNKTKTGTPATKGQPFWNTPYRGTSCTWRFAPKNSGDKHPLLKASFRAAFAVNVSVFDGGSDNAPRIAFFEGKEHPGVDDGAISAQARRRANCAARRRPHRRYLRPNL